MNENIDLRDRKKILKGRKYLIATTKISKQ